MRKMKLFAQVPGELDRRHLALREERGQLSTAVETVNEQHRHSAGLEHAAAQRLAAMNEKDEAIAGLRDALSGRDLALNEPERRVPPRERDCAVGQLRIGLEGRGPAVAEARRELDLAI